jgi:hypothetical protein
MIDLLASTHARAGQCPLTKLERTCLFADPRPDHKMSRCPQSLRRDRQAFDDQRE